MTESKLKGVTNIGEWVTWDPSNQCMQVKTGGTWIFEGGKLQEYTGKTFTDPQFLDARQGLVTPGLIDPHTHPVFVETRELEFELRSQGKSYQEIAAAGGGILNSVRKLRNNSEAELTGSVQHHLNLMLAHGTTSVECKSGYGLSTESEIKSLRALQKASQDHPIRTHATFLGAHEVPDEYREDKAGYIDLLVKEMIPRVASQGLAEYCDVFCEEGVYTPAETRRILNAARSAGMKLRFHADEFVSTGGAELAVALGAHSADHLMAISDDGIQALAQSSTVGTLLPGTTFFLGTNTWAPARKMLDAGVEIALATDFNPGSNMSVSLPFVMTLAVIYLKMTPLEALKAVTYGAAKSLGIETSRGILSQGFDADLVVWESKNYRQLPYFYASNQVAQVLLNGDVVVDRRL